MYRHCDLKSRTINKRSTMSNYNIHSYKHVKRYVDFGFSQPRDIDNKICTLKRTEIKQQFKSPSMKKYQKSTYVYLRTAQMKNSWIHFKTSRVYWSITQLCWKIISKLKTHNSYAKTVYELKPWETTSG